MFPSCYWIFKSQGWANFVYPLVLVKMLWALQLISENCCCPSLTPPLPSRCSSGHPRLSSTAVFWGSEHAQIHQFLPYNFDVPINGPIEHIPYCHFPTRLCNSHKLLNQSQPLWRTSQTKTSLIILSWDTATRTTWWCDADNTLFSDHSSFFSH